MRHAEENRRPTNRERDDDDDESKTGARTSGQPFTNTSNPLSWCEEDSSAPTTERENREEERGYLKKKRYATQYEEDDVVLLQRGLLLGVGYVYLLHVRVMSPPLLYGSGI